MIQVGLQEEEPGYIYKRHALQPIERVCYGLYDLAASTSNEPDGEADNRVPCLS